MGLQEGSDYNKVNETMGKFGYKPAGAIIENELGLVSGPKELNNSYWLVDKGVLVITYDLLSDDVIYMSYCYYLKGGDREGNKVGPWFKVSRFNINNGELTIKTKTNKTE